MIYKFVGFLVSLKREVLANEQHGIWAHWMRYVFSICPENADGSVTIPSDKVKRWKRQIDTSYIDLTEKEKDSDRNQVDKIVGAISNKTVSKRTFLY